MTWTVWDASTDPFSLFHYLQAGGVVGLLALIIVGTVRKWWAPSWYVAALERERDEWKMMALSGTRLAERSSSVLEEAVKRGMAGG